MTDVKTTLRKSFVLRGSDPIKYAYAIDDLEDQKPQLVISENIAIISQRYFENLYEHTYKNSFPDKSEFKTVLYEDYEKAIPIFKVAQIKMDKETNQFDFSLPDGTVDTSNKTINFKETPILLMTFSLGLTMQPNRPITYQYELDGDTLVISARGNNERGVFNNNENDIQESNRIERSLHMYQSITKKLTLWIAFLSLLLLTGCTGNKKKLLQRSQK